jgi:hypothetical protein
VRSRLFVALATSPSTHRLVPDLITQIREEFGFDFRTSCCVRNSSTDAGRKRIRFPARMKFKSLREAQRRMVFGAKPVRSASSFVLRRTFEGCAPSGSRFDPGNPAFFSTTVFLSGRTVPLCSALTAHTPVVASNTSNPRLMFKRALHSGDLASPGDGAPQKAFRSLVSRSKPSALTDFASASRKTSASEGSCL